MASSKRARSVIVEAPQAARETVVVIPRHASSPLDPYVMMPTTHVAKIVNSPAQQPFVELQWTPLAIQWNIVLATPLLVQPMSRPPMERPVETDFSAQAVPVHHEIFSVNRLSMGVPAPVTIPLVC